MLYAKQNKQNGYLSGGPSRPSSSSLWSSMTNSQMSLNPPPMIAPHEIGSINSGTRDFETNLNENNNLDVNVGIIPIVGNHPTAPQNPVMICPSMRGAEAISKDSKLVVPGRGKIVNYPRCAKCQNHGQFILLKNHKRYCAWKDCHCERCCRTNELKRAKATHEAKRRWKKVDEELSLSVAKHIKTRGGSQEVSPLLTGLLNLGSPEPETAAMNGQPTSTDHYGREYPLSLPMNLLNELNEHPTTIPRIEESEVY